MADYRSVACPHCGAKLLSTYRVDNSHSITHTKCPKCRKSVAVEHGNGKIKAFNE